MRTSQSIACSNIKAGVTPEMTCLTEPTKHCYTQTRMGVGTESDSRADSVRSPSSSPRKLSSRTAVCRMEQPFRDTERLEPIISSEFKSTFGSHQCHRTSLIKPSEQSDCEHFLYTRVPLPTLAISGSASLMGSLVQCWTPRTGRVLTEVTRGRSIHR